MKLFGFTVAREKTKALAPVNTRGGWWPLVREPFAGAWQQNKEIAADDYLASPIVYACLTLIANDIGKLRARVMQRDADGVWSEQRDASTRARTLRKPNHFQNQIQFKQWWVTSKLRFGNAYVLLRRDENGLPREMFLLDPQRVTPLVTDDGQVFYQLSPDNMGDLRASVTVPASEIIHDRMNCLYHPLVGVPPIYAAAIAAGIGIHIQRNVANFFANSARPSGILIAPGSLDPDNAKAMLADWNTNFGGINNGKVAMLGDGFKFEPLAQKAVDAQLIETLKWSDERICSVFHVPAYKVGVGAPPSYNNIEALAQEYYSTCLQVLIEEMEACLDEGFGYVPELFNRGIELDLDGLLRMDGKTLMETLKTGVDAALVTPNEGRKRMNLRPLDGGDTVYMQQQNYSLGALAERDRNSPLLVQEAPPPEPEPLLIEDESSEEKAALATYKAIEAMKNAL